MLLTTEVVPKIFPNLNVWCPFGISNLLKVATSNITRFALDLDLQKQQK